MSAGDAPALTHVDARGEARMVDVGAKPPAARFAAAEGAVRMSAEEEAMVKDRLEALGYIE